MSRALTVACLGSSPWIDLGDGLHGAGEGILISLLPAAALVTTLFLRDFKLPGFDGLLHLPNISVYLLFCVSGTIGEGSTAVELLKTGAREDRNRQITGWQDFSSAINRALEEAKEKGGATTSRSSAEGEREVV